MYIYIQELESILIKKIYIFKNVDEYNYRFKSNTLISSKYHQESIK